MEFKQAVEKQGQAEEQAIRAISRKSSKPKANKKNYEQENKDFGVKNEVDLVLQRIAGQKEIRKTDFEYQEAKGQYARGMHAYSGDGGQTKKKKQVSYLTVQSLLDHPYFLAINTADISSVIDEYEVLLNGEGHRAAY